jgi:hypothetical protein
VSVGLDDEQPARPNEDPSYWLNRPREIPTKENDIGTRIVELAEKLHWTAEIKQLTKKPNNLVLSNLEINPHQIFGRIMAKIPESLLQDSMSPDCGVVVGIFNRSPKFVHFNPSNFQNLIVCQRSGPGDFVNTMFQACGQLKLTDHPDSAYEDYFFDNPYFTSRKYYLEYFKSLDPVQLKDWIMAINFTGKSINTWARFQFIDACRTDPQVIRRLHPDILKTRHFRHCNNIAIFPKGRKEAILEKSKHSFSNTIDSYVTCEETYKVLS